MAMLIDLQISPISDVESVSLPVLMAILLLLILGSTPSSILGELDLDFGVNFGVLVPSLESLEFLAIFMPLTLLAILAIPFFVFLGFLVVLYESTNDPALEGSWVFGVRRTVELFTWPSVFLLGSILIWGLVIFITQFFGSLIHSDVSSMLLIPTVFLFILLEPLILLIGFLIALIKFILDFTKEIKKV